VLAFNNCHEEESGCHDDDASGFNDDDGGQRQRWRRGVVVPTAKEGTCLRGRDIHSSFLFLINKSLFFNLKSQSLNFYFCHVCDIQTSD